MPRREEAERDRPSFDGSSDDAESAAGKAGSSAGSSTGSQGAEAPQRLSYRDQLRASGEQALQRTWQHGGGHLILPSTAAHADTTGDLLQGTPGAYFLPPVAMTAHGSPSRQDETVQPGCVSGEPCLGEGTTQGWSGATSESLSCSMASSYWAGIPGGFDVAARACIAPQLGDAQLPALMAAAMLQAADSSLYHREQIAAQLRAAAPCYYED